jgi:hypothetical protein
MMEVGPSITVAGPVPPRDYLVDVFQIHQNVKFSREIPAKTLPNAPAGITTLLVDAAPALPHTLRR